YYEGPFDIPPTGLVAGDNVLAVEVHQTSATSSDVTMGLQLFMLGSVPAPSETLLKFTSMTRVGTSLQIEWIGSGTLLSADSVLGPWSVVTNAANPFTASIDGSAKFFRLTQ